jgi:hypothetical protein
MYPQNTIVSRLFAIHSSCLVLALTAASMMPVGWRSITPVYAEPSLLGVPAGGGDPAAAGGGAPAAPGGEPQPADAGESPLPVTPPPVTMELAYNAGAVPREGRTDYPYVRNWMKSNQGVSHVILLTPQGQPVWSDIPLDQIRNAGNQHLEQALGEAQKWNPEVFQSMRGNVTTVRIAPGLQPGKFFVSGLAIVIWTTDANGSW